MAIEFFDEDMDIIQKLDDAPGLPYKELQARFDRSGNLLKSFLNNVVIPAINGIQAITGTTDTTFTREGAPADSKAVGTRFTNLSSSISNALQRIGNLENTGVTVTTGRLADKAVTNSKLADGSVSKEKLENGLALSFFPVGYIWISASPTSPAAVLGGKWEQIKGKFLLAQDADHPAGTEGGSSTVTLTADNLPEHDHASIDARYYGSFVAENTRGTVSGWDVGDTSENLTKKSEYRTGKTGSSQAIDITPPYLAVYMWQRTA